MQQHDQIFGESPNLTITLSELESFSRARPNTDAIMEAERAVGFMHKT